jgi:hypothetical protein
MNRQVYRHRRDRRRRSLVIAVLFVTAMLYSRSTALASCGDYLLHGQSAEHRTASSAAAVQQSLGFDTPLASESPVNVPPPGSPCASGRCHSLPVGPPLNHPSRAVIWKQSPLPGTLTKQRTDADLLRWAYPADGTLPRQPLLAIELPPPRPALWHA